MLSQKSLRARFVLQLASAGAMLIVIFSVILYHYIEISIFENVALSLTNEAKRLEHFTKEQIGQLRPENIKLQALDVKIKKAQFSYNDDKTELSLHYPTKFGSLLLEKSTKEYSKIVDQILSNIIFINATAIFLILFYALFLSRILLLPIRSLALRLSKLNENFLKGVESTQFPSEFEPLANSINRLIERIQGFSKYQKELFIGAAHELKTPLAVMKTKNEVTMLKERSNEQYIEALKQNNISIDQMNKMVSSILEIGRGEAAQFEKPTKVDITEFLDNICHNFASLARERKIKIITRLKPNELKINIQTTLFTHIVQNFLQNSIKFSPDGANILVSSKLLLNTFEIHISDEGCGIDESKDLFAPFKRYGKAGGSGLGLFLAKNAADALGAKIDIKNRKDGKNGSIASFYLKIN